MRKLGIFYDLQVNHVDVASNYAGIMMGMTNSVANICGFLAPYIIGIIVTTEGSVQQWQVVFFITAAVYTVTNLFFVIFGTGEEQSWNRQSKDGDKEEHRNDA